MRKTAESPVIKIQTISSHFEQPTPDWLPYGNTNVRLDHPAEYEGIVLVQLDRDYANELRCSAWDASDIPDDILYPLVEEIASQHGLEQTDVILDFSFEWLKSPTDVFQIKYWN